MPLRTPEEIEEIENSQSDGGADGAELQAVQDRQEELDDDVSLLFERFERMEERVAELERRNDAQRDVIEELLVAVTAMSERAGDRALWDTADVDIDPDGSADVVDFEDLGDPYDPSKEFE